MLPTMWCMILSVHSAVWDRMEQIQHAVSQWVAFINLIFTVIDLNINFTVYKFQTVVVVVIVGVVVALVVVAAFVIVVLVIVQWWRILMMYVTE